MIEIQVLLTYLTLISVPIGVFYHILTLFNTRKNQEHQLDTRQAQLFMQIYSRLNDETFVNNVNLVRFEWSFTDLNDFMEKYGYDKNPVGYDKLSSIVYYFEGLGVLIEKGLINPELVDDLMSGLIISIWEKMEPIVLEMRKRYDWPTLAEWFEYLYKTIKTIYDEQHPEFTEKTITVFKE